MHKFTIMAPVKGTIIMYLALNQDLEKSICDTMVLLLNNILSSSVPVDVSQAVFSKQLKCAIINDTLWKITCLEYIYDIDH